MRKLRIALSQMNSSVGDIAGNTRKIIANIEKARDACADIVIFPEMAVCGYPPEDLLLKSEFIEENLRSLERIREATSQITAIVGFVDAQEDIYNAAAVLHDEQVAGICHKFALPNYGVFDENRYFQQGTDYMVFVRDEVTFGVTICEDMWNAEGPARIQSLLGDAQLIVSINASPFHYGKWRLRERVYATRAFDGSYFLAYVNAVGGQDELIFDGHSMLFSPSGELLQRGLSLEEELILGDIDISEVFKTRLLDPRRRKAKLVLKDSGMVCHQIRLSPIPRRDRPSIAGRQVNPPADIEEIYRSLVLGIGDYVRKNGFSDVVIGLSGGLDSAITAALAVKALGKEHVVGVYMPAVFSSTESREDAEALAGSLEMRFFEIPIQDTFESYKAMLAGMFKGRAEDVTEENIQARIRGTILMALSNKFNWLVLTTGNKSETACGYCTLYGDTAGGFAPLKDVSKTQAYQLCEYVNSAGEIIPRRIIEKPPSAELRFNQKDTDSLPPYDHLDALLYLYIEKELSIRDIIAHGFDEELVKSVIRMVDRNEYKRRQAPPGIKITEKAFGRDRRLPVTNLFKPWASH